MPLRSFALLLLFALTVPQSALAENGCLKQVFGEYCLGGSLQRLLQRKPSGIPQLSGDRSAVVYLQGRGRTYVMAYRDRIYKVLQTFEPATQVTLKDLNERLSAKYGPFEDLSLYPGYARNPSARISAIRRGEGELRYRWQNEGDSWRVELGWARKLGISLTYLANELDAQQQAALDKGL